VDYILPFIFWCAVIAGVVLGAQKIYERRRGDGAGTDLNDLLNIQAQILEARSNMDRLKRRESSKARMLQYDRDKLEREQSMWYEIEYALSLELDTKVRRLQDLDGKLHPNDSSSAPRVILREWIQRKVI
jgi:hypothetical protein